VRFPRTVMNLEHTNASDRTRHVRDALSGMATAVADRDRVAFLHHLDALLATPADAECASYRTMMASWVHPLLLNEADTDDAVSMATMKVVTAALRTFETGLSRGRGHLDLDRALAHDLPEASVATYLRVTVTRVALDVLRKRKRAAPVEDLDQAARWEAANGPDEAERLAVRVDLRAALARLAPELALVVQLHCVEGLTQDEVAERIAMSRPTVSARLKRAREELAAAMAG
jgi:RNA polymerase sigma factor (sigma-70 family)